MELIKSIINILSGPPIMFTIVMAVFFFIFPPADWFVKWNKKFHINKLWTAKGGITIFLVLISFFTFGLFDENFRLIMIKPDNVPIPGLIFLTVFFLWFSMKQATKNDQRLKDGGKPAEHIDAEEKVLVWPDLVYIELIAIVLCTALLFVWSVGISAPLEGPANPTNSPNPSKAPWYFLGLQESLVYFDPWLAGVVLPTLIILGLMAIPYIDVNDKHSGYFCFEGRKMAISLFMFGWLVLWVLLIVVGTALRGPNWNFFGPFEQWDIFKLEPLMNVNLSEYIYIVLLKRPLPENILIREMWGFFLVLGYFLILPPVLAKTALKKLYKKLGNFRYSVFIILLLSMFFLPAKMYLRWLFNLKYIIAIPEFFFNI